MSKETARFVIGGVYRREMPDLATIYGVLTGAREKKVGSRTGVIQPHGHGEEYVSDGQMGDWTLVSEPVSVELLAEIERLSSELPLALAVIEELRNEVQRISLASGVRPSASAQSAIDELAARRRTV